MSSGSGSRPTAGMIALIEQRLGYRLPASYIELMQHRNGGIPTKTSHRTSEATSWAEDHIAITGIFSIGYEKPSAGHDMVCLDYRECGPSGEPSVVHVDQEYDFKITFVAESFEAFIRGLESYPDE